MNKSFFAMLSRMKYVNRWGLMRNASTENISEHSHQVAILAHALAVIGNKKFSKNYNCERAAVLGLYHDATETITGDMPTPVKYYNDSIINAYKDIEKIAAHRLLAMLPDEFHDEFSPLLVANESDKELWKLVKAADKLSAYIKSLEEIKSGNVEFESASKSLKAKIDAIDMEEVKYFKEHFLPAFSMNLDEHTK